MGAKAGAVLVAPTDGKVLDKIVRDRKLGVAHKLEQLITKKIIEEKHNKTSTEITTSQFNMYIYYSASTKTKQKLTTQKKQLFGPATTGIVKLSILPHK